MDTAVGFDAQTCLCHVNTPTYQHQKPFYAQLPKIENATDYRLHKSHPFDDARFALIGGKSIGAATLLRFYVLHCVAIPLAAGFLMAIHFWRVRKDGGISGPL